MTEEQTGIMLSDKTYKTIKPVVQIVMPAIATLYMGLDALWGLPAEDQVVGTISLVTVFLGTILGISSKRYHNSDAPYDGKMVVTEDPGGVKNFSLELDGDPEAMKDMKAVSFKVEKQIVE